MIGSFLKKEDKMNDAAYIKAKYEFITTVESDPMLKEKVENVDFSTLTESELDTLQRFIDQDEIRAIKFFTDFLKSEYGRNYIKNHY